MKLTKITPFSAPPLECHKTQWVQAFVFKKKSKDDSGAHFTRDSYRLTIYVIELSYIIIYGRSLKDHRLHDMIQHRTNQETRWYY